MNKTYVEIVAKTGDAEALPFKYLSKIRQSVLFECIDHTSWKVCTENQCFISYWCFHHRAEDDSIYIARIIESANENTRWIYSSEPIYDRNTQQYDAMAYLTNLLEDTEIVL